MKFTLLLVAAIFSIGSVHAQTSESLDSLGETTTVKTEIEEVSPSRLRSMLSFAPVMGISTFGFTGARSVGERFGVVKGAIANFDLETIGFQVGVQYMQTGGRFSGPERKGASYDLGYIGVPLVFKSFLAGNERTVYLKAGMIPLFNTTVVGNEANGSDIDQGDIAKFDTLAQIGVGFQETPRKWGGVGFGMDVSYNRGLIDVKKEQGTMFNEGLISSFQLLF